MTLLIVLALVLLAALGAPLFSLVAAVAWIGLRSAGYDETLLAAQFWSLTEMPVLIAIPLFTLAGYLLSESGAPKRLLRLSEALLGWLHGGLAIVALGICAFFTAFTGVSGVTIIAFGALLLPMLRQAGYPERFSYGVVTTAPSLGMLFVPSVPLILYGIVAQQLGTTPGVSVTDMFAAGVLPGLMMLVVVSLYCMWRAPKRAHDVPFSAAEARAAIWDARWELPLPVILIGGVYGGFFATSEAAAVVAIYVLAVTVFIRREIPFAKLPGVLRESMMLVGAILMILGVSLALTNVIIDAEIPARLIDWVSAHVDSRLAFLLLLNLFLLGVGMVLDVFSATVIIVPILLPIAMHYGVHPVHLGIMFLANMEIGYFMPPMGMNLFIASYRFDKPVLTLARACVPFFFLLFACVLVITYWPGLSLVWVD
jgi:C4-dicarboxylate transporter, DctM subunit